MAIVQLDKLTLYGAESHQEVVIQRLQALGSAHLLNLTSGSGELVAGDLSAEARDALKFLRACSEQRRQVRRRDEFDREQVVEDALNIQRALQDRSDERDALEKAIEDLEPWGEFRLPDDAIIGDVRFWFYVVPLRDFDKVVAVGLPLREVSRDHQHAQVVMLSREEPTDIAGTLVELDSRPLSELRRRLEEIEEQLADLHHERVGLTRWCDLLAGALDEADDAAARAAAVRQSLKGHSVFALQAWIPRDATDEIYQFAKENNLAVTIEPPAPDEEPPTLLHNPERVAGSEGLVTFYKTPAYRSWDPSLIAYGSFAVFFAMIIADAGYGVIFALLTAYFWKRMRQTRAGRRASNVLATVVGLTIVYGVVCGSYFGVSPAADSSLGKLRMLDAQSQSLMMPLTILIGVIHLSLANLITAWLERRRLAALSSLGWVAVMIGATLAGMGVFADLSGPTADKLEQGGSVLLIGGLAAVFLFSSQRPLLSLSIKNHVLRIFEGLQGLTGLSGLFGDVLSYLRLFALGLSSAKLAETFNRLGASAWDEAGFGVIAAIGIVILGHTLNLVLGIMSGVVHGLRLNCIEFFKWSLPEEGYSFKAFAKKARQP